MVREIRTNRIGRRLGTVLCSGLPVSFYNIRFPLLYPYHPAASLLQAASRILCNTLHKPCEAPYSKRTDTDRLEVTEGDMYITRRSFKTVRRKVRPGCPLPCFICTLPLFYFLLYRLSFLFSPISIAYSLSFLLLYLSFRFPGSFLPSPVGFIRCKGLLPRLIRRLEMYFLQILPFHERVIGRKSRRMKLFRQPCTASIKSQAVQAEKRTEQREK